jgi:hypothetical protein
MSHPDAPLTAKRTLFQLGHELPGRRLQRLAAQLLVASRAEPDASARDLVERARSAIEDGPTALVAEEPDLRHARLDPPVVTVEEGATAAVEALGHRLLAVYRLP